MQPLLILRPEPGNSATVARANALGVQTVSVPLFEAKPVPWVPSRPANFDAILLTSATALRMAGPDLQDYFALPAYCVGQATASEAKASGFATVFTGSHGVDEAVSAAHGKRLIHICGEDRIAPSDTAAPITPVICYQMVPRDVSASLATALAQAPVVLLHSPKAAQHFASLVRDKSRIALCALSPAIADAAGKGWEDVAISPKPRDDDAIKTATAHFNLIPNPRLTA